MDVPNVCGGIPKGALVSTCTKQLHNCASWYIQQEAEESSRPSVVLYLAHQAVRLPEYAETNVKPATG